MDTDVYTRITDRIVAELETGIRPWMKPWNAEHAAGKVTRPLRVQRIRCQGLRLPVLAYVQTSP